MLSHFHMGHESHAADSKPQRLHADETPHQGLRKFPGSPNWREDAAGWGG
ncbi:hypothetical protein GCM10009646_90090 [Streptomyces aureus]